MRESFAWFVLVLSVMLMLLCVLMLHRNNFVYRVQVAFIERGDWGSLYLKLPSYEQMLYSPKYLLLWTPAHWEAWVARQGVSAQSQEA